MSHFLTLVLVEREGTPPGELLEKEPERVLAEVARLLAPFDEAIQVKPYRVDCSCVGLEALVAGRAYADRTVGTWDGKREEFRKTVAAQMPEEERNDPQGLDAAWQAFTADFRERWDAVIAEASGTHPMAGKPDPGCGECAGSGVRTTTYNPKSRWDWYVVGGRWDGIVRHGVYREEPAERDNLRALRHNAVPVPELRENILEYAHAILTPDGRWYEQGKMGWWGMVHDRRPDGEWRDEAARLLLAHRDAVAVGCDLHI